MTLESEAAVEAACHETKQTIAGKQVSRELSSTIPSRESWAPLCHISYLPGDPAVSCSNFARRGLQNLN